MRKAAFLRSIPLLAAALLMTGIFNLNAQSLPGVQQTSIFAPANIKIDGKTSEWNNKFQANNKATDLFYTVANDKNNLYIVIQAADPVIAKKILGGGLKFTVNNQDKKNSEDNITFHFPEAHMASASKVASLLNKMTAMPAATDSLLSLINAEIANANNQIKVKNLLAVNDTLLSVYNEDGIKVAMLFDGNKALTYEAAIPLKYLGLSVKEGSKLMYNILLSGIMQSSKRVTRIINGQTVTFMSTSSDMGGAPTDFQTLSYPTDFWGEYILAKSR